MLRGFERETKGDREKFEREREIESERESLRV